MSKFVHLHLHTEYSLVDGLIRIKPLMKHIANNDMAAVGITDQSNLFAMVKAYRASMGNGVKPVFGCDLILPSVEDSKQANRVLFLCQNNQGYQNLTELISLSYQKGQSEGVPYVHKEWIAERSEGLIVLSGGLHGEVGQALVNGNQKSLDESLSFWMEHFPDRFYLELMRTDRQDEQEHVDAAVALAVEKNLPVVASNDVCFVNRKDYYAHEARTCIRGGYVLADKKRPRKYSEEQYLKSPEEMCELFSDIPEAIENTVEIAKRCNVTLELDKPVLPDFPVPEGMTEGEFFAEESRKGLVERLKKILPADAPDREAKLKEYDERLEIELGVILQMGFPGYFLIVADFIQWAKDQDIPVGPGRGSGAGSLVAYALKITDLDPLEYDLLFERFLNPERVSMPDFDIDFCMDNRDEVIAYVARRYGREKVSQIITYGSMAAKAVIRDCGRVLGNGYGFVDRVAKLIPFEIGMTLTKALEMEPDLQRLYDEDEEVKGLLDLALQLEGITRNTGKHAGGVVIAPTGLTDFTPLYCDEDGTNLVTQFDKDDVEAVGLVKFDFLGLRTLTIIDWAIKAIDKQRADNGEGPLDISEIPLDDKKAFKLLKAQQTTAVFQLESRGMKDLIKRLQPDVFEDIIALVALFRPGPLQSGMVDDFIARKHGLQKVEYPHPALEPILQPTYGVILYQEQVMQIAQVLAGYSLGGADMLRRAMGKKKPEEMAKQRDLFQEGSVANGVDADVATYIFDLMEKFAGYGFNKSHSAAYALLSYQTAWLKAHYPGAFMASVLSADMDNTDKVVTLIEECRSMKLDVSVPAVNQSEYAFKAVSNTAILYGLGAIKGVGEGAIEAMIQERKANGKFSCLDNLCCRVDTHKINRRVMEASIRAGAMDDLGPSRRSLFEWLNDSLDRAVQHHRDAMSGQNDLFGGAVALQETEEREGLEEWDEADKLRYEKDTLGLYLTGHPIQRFLPELKPITSSRLKEVNEIDPSQVKGRGNEKDITIAGLMIDIRIKTTKRGRMAFIVLDDQSGRIEASVFGDEYEQYGHLLVKDEVVIVKGSLGYDEFSGQMRLRVRSLLNIENARGHYARFLEVSIPQSRLENGNMEKLSQLLQPFREGTIPVIVNYKNHMASAQVKLSSEWLLNPTDECLNLLRDFTGDKDSVHVRY